MRKFVGNCILGLDAVQIKRRIGLDMSDDIRGT